MAKCEYYRVHVQPGRPAASIPESKAPWCAHPQSRVLVFAVARHVGGAKLLQCDGDQGKCNLPAVRSAKT